MIARRPWFPALLAGIVMLGACSSSPSSDEADDAVVPEAAETDDDTAPTPEEEPDAPQVTDVSGASGFSNDRLDILGNPIWATGPGNIPVTSDNELAIRFSARRTGSIDRVSFNLKYDFERAGYHGGTCGRLQVSVRPDDGGAPAETSLGSLVLDDPCSGERDIGWLVDLPFDEPIDVVGGEIHHLVFTNLDPDPANFMSINLLYRPDDAGHALEVSTGDGVLAVHSRGSAYWSGNETGDWGASDVLADHHPAFELTYADGSRQGVSYVGARFDQEVFLEPSNPVRLRQLFTPRQDRTLEALWFRGVEASGDAELEAALTAGDGARIWAGPLTRDPESSWFTAAFPSPLALDADVEYAVEVTGVAGRVEVRPLYQAQHDDWTSNESSDWASTRLEIGQPGAWEPYLESIPHDLSLFFDTDPEPTSGDTSLGDGAQEEALQVMVYGDSLLGEPIVEASFRAGLEARGMELVGLDSEAGRSTADLAALVADAPVAADVYVINIGINGGEAGAAFEDDARAVADALYSASPQARILWSNLHALPTRFEYIVDERVTPRNSALIRLDGDGVIEVVDWASVAELNPDIYSDDGVHYFGREDRYLDTIFAAIDRLDL